MELRSAVSATPTPAQNSVCRTVDNTPAGYNFPEMFENPAVPHERYSPNDGAAGLVSSTFENCVVNNLGQYSGGGNSHVGGVPDTNKNIKNSYFNCVVNNVANGVVPSELMPCGLMPSGRMPCGLLPSGFVPSGLLPSGNMPSGVLPSGLFPSGLLPSGVLPSALMPNASNNHGSAANIPNSALNNATDTHSKKTAMLAIEGNQRAMSTVLNTDNCALSKFHQSTKRLTDRAVERVQRLRAETMERAKEGRARTVEDKRHASMLAIEGNSVGETFEELKEVGEKNEQLKEKKEENIEEKEKDDKVNEGQECDAGKKKNEKMRKRGATRSRKRIKSENMRSLNPSTSIGVITMSFPKRSSDSF